MTTERNDGGPAFPNRPYIDHSTSLKCDPGMTLRDYFAAKAMQAIIAATYGKLGDHSPAWTAKLSLEYADAMIAERERAK